MRLYPPAGITSLPSALVQLVAHNVGSFGLNAVLDDRAGITLVSDPANSPNWRVLMEYTIQVEGNANVAVDFQFAFHDPNHVNMFPGTHRWTFAATGAGDVFQTTAICRGMRENYLSGSYHINVTVATGVSANTNARNGKLFVVRT